MSQSKGTKPKRAKRTTQGMSWRQVRQAKADAAAARARRLQTLQRAAPASTDARYVETKIKTRIIRDVTAIVDADRELPGWVEERIRGTYKRPGRPRELTIRTALILFCLQTIIHRDFHLWHLAQTLGDLSWRTRRHLGIDRLRNGQPTEVTYTQLLDVFHAMAKAFDAWDEDLVDDEDEDLVRMERAANLQEFINRLTAASTSRAPMWRGDVALDATMKWSWERPPGSLNAKIERRGNDGDAGAPGTLEQLVGTDENGELNRDAFTTDTPAEATRKHITRRLKRKKGWPATWSLGSAWVGRANKAKAVHGVALHAVVRADAGSPDLIEGFVVTPAVHDPSAAVLPLLRDLHDRRATVAGPGEAPLGLVIADPGYSALDRRHWQLPIRELGAQPIFRLHRTNQDGIRWEKVGPKDAKIDVPVRGGRPMCECAVHVDGADEIFPPYPYPTEARLEYEVKIRPVLRFEWKPNGDFRPDGSRQFIAPHETGPDGQPGGCPVCTRKDGRRALKNGRPLPRCCQKRSRVFPAEAIAWWQPESYGTSAWYDMWNYRNRVEGTFGIMKNSALLNYGRNYHHFVGLARETLVAAFAIVAYNFHMLRSWEAKQDLPVATDGSPSERQPIETLPPDLAARIRGEQVLAEIELPEDRGPKGVDFLGQPLASAPPG